jgi:hypothetical protein
VTGPILVVGGRHRKGSAIPAEPHLAQLQSSTYQSMGTDGTAGFDPSGTWRSARGTDLYRSLRFLSRGTERRYGAGGETSYQGVKR